MATKDEVERGDGYVGRPVLKNEPIEFKVTARIGLRKTAIISALADVVQAIALVALAIGVWR